MKKKIQGVFDQYTDRMGTVIGLTMEGKKDELYGLAAKK